MNIIEKSENPEDGKKIYLIFRICFFFWYILCTDRKRIYKRNNKYKAVLMFGFDLKDAAIIICLYMVTRK